MGLDFKGSKAHWAYSGFHVFRCKLANEIGINLDDMVGFERDKISWDNIKDPIKSLLDHSDCDGKLSPKACAKIAPRLRELIRDWDDCDYDKIQGLLLAEGMEECAINKTNLIFC